MPGLRFALAALSSALSAQALKVGVISDLHMNPYYSATASEDTNCVASNAAGTVSNDTAPIGRINCDPSPVLVGYMLQRFTEAFGDVDVILVTGDHVAHKVSPHHGQGSPEAWAKLKDNLDQSAQLLQKHFPSKIVLTNIGNNDGYHSQAPDESQKSTLYGYLYDLWFKQFPGNAGILDSVKQTFMSAGYYRVDLTDSISVLTFDNQYMDNDDDTSFQKNEANEQLDWLETQLSAEIDTGRKFILSCHVYAGVRYSGTQLWHKDFTDRYFQILRDYHEQVVIEVAGHDHYADLRYHSSFNVLDMEDTETKFDFHNIFVAPGVTPNKGNNPGVAMFEVDDGVAHNLQMEFIDLVPQVGKSSVDYSDLKFLSLPLSDYGVTSVSSESLSEFRKALEGDKDMTLEYLVRKMGFDPTDSDETQMAYAIYEDKDLITTGKQKTGEFICEMHQSLSPEEYTDCTAAANFAEFMAEEAYIFLQ